MEYNVTVDFGCLTPAAVYLWGELIPSCACLQLEVNISNYLFLTAECHANVGTLLPLVVLLGSECASCRQKAVKHFTSC